MNKEWLKYFRLDNKSIDSAFPGWYYSVLFDSDYFSNKNRTNENKSYTYKSESNLINDDLNQLENLNKNTCMQLSHRSKSQVAIIGCGPVGMSMALHLHKRYPDIQISIFEKRINQSQNTLKDFSRRWLTSISIESLTPILNSQDISLLKKIGKNGFIGVDIRNLEYCLLRALRVANIPICAYQEDIPKPSILVDASGGRFITRTQKKIINRREVVFSDYTSIDNIFGQKSIKKEKLEKFEIVDFGDVLKPFYNNFPIQVTYMKINYLPIDLKDDFISFMNNVNNDYSIFYWNGLMQEKINRSLLFISLFAEEVFLLDELILYPMRLDDLYNMFKTSKNNSKRLLVMMEWLLNHLDSKKMCYVEPLFTWNPYLCPRSNYIREDIEYLNIGDSYYIGHPKAGNGLAKHLKEIYHAFRN